MDDSFQLRARRLLGDVEPAALDFSVLTACLAAQQAATPAARALAVAPAIDVDTAGTAAIEEILLCGPDWRRAASAQQGCFNRAEVKRRNKGP